MHVSTPLRDSLPARLSPEPLVDSPQTSDLRAHLESVRDLSSWSDELAAISTEHPLSYFFSPARANVLRGLNLPVESVVLEVGARAGAITRYLGEESVLVDALEPDAAMAELARGRCADLETVSVHSLWLDAVPAVPVYDLIVAVDVLGELEHRKVPLAHFLRECAARLKPDGVIVLGADNADGVRHLSGGLPPAAGITSPRRSPWLDLHTLTDAVAAAQLQVEVASAFPDHRLTKVLFKHDDLAAIAPELITTLPSFPSPAYGAPVTDPKLEGRQWSSLAGAGSAEGHANSIVAVISTAAPLLPIDPASYWSSGRAAALSAHNRVRVQDATAVIDRRAAFPRAPGPDGPLRLVPQIEAHVTGRTLVALLTGATTADEAESILHRWVALVEQSGDPDCEVPWDLIPRNVIVDADGHLHAIDQEWAMTGTTASTVLRRGTFWLAADLLDAPTRPPWLRGQTHGQIADFLWRLAGQDARTDWLATFVQDEARATAYVSPLKPPRSRHHVERQNGRILSAMSNSQPQGDQADHRPRPSTIEPSLQAVVDSLLATNEQLRAQLEQLDRERRHDALTQRDHVIGMTAELEVMRDRVGRSQAAQKLAMTKVRRLRKQVADMQASTTWRIGRWFVAPLARLRGRR